jgi:hypothetical protein
MAKSTKARKKPAQVRSAEEARLLAQKRQLQRAARLQTAVRQLVRKTERAKDASDDALRRHADWLAELGYTHVERPKAET